AWHFTVLDEQKHCITNTPAMATDKLRAALKTFLGTHSAHVFVRPLLGNFVFLDLDDFTTHNKDLTEVLSLKPRALVRTSPNKYQAWLILPESLASSQAPWAARAMPAHFKRDDRSLKATQQGRVPGSMNVKAGKGTVTELVHNTPGATLNEDAFFKMVPKQKVHIQGATVASASAPIEEKAAADRSGQDWKLCCQLFEDPAGYSFQMGLQALLPKMTKAQARPDWCASQTIEKAFQKVGGHAAIAADPAASSSKPAAAVSQKVAQPPPRPAESQQVPPQSAAPKAPQQPAPSGGAQAPGDGGNPPQGDRAPSQGAAPEAPPQPASSGAAQAPGEGGHAAAPGQFACVGDIQDGFYGAQWAADDADRACEVCKPLDEAQLRRLKTAWTCKQCGPTKARGMFTPARRRHYAAALKKFQEKGKDNVVDHNARRERNLDAELPTWERKTKDEATRWIMQADETALPSECLQSYQACIALRGRQEWWLSAPGQSKSEFTAAEKLKHLDAAHADLSHLRGRDGVVGVLEGELGDR
ncbi:unnamed protein product, partial [Prorocentrum cordatum]